MKKDVTIPATLQAVSNFCTQLDTLFAAMNMEVRVKSVLAIQELLVNIVKHAYDGVEGHIKFEIQWEDEELKIQVTDQAPREFIPPAEITAPDPFSLPEGGMGLFILHQSFDDVQYTRQNGENIWRLRKTLVIESGAES